MRQDGKIDVKRLIMEVYKQPALWDQKHVLYHYRETKNRIWLELSTNLNIPKSILKTKWKGLRDTFRAELKKGIIYRKSKNLKYKPTWVHYKHLLFLKEQIISKPPVWESNGNSCPEKFDIHSADDINDRAAKESSKRILNLSDVKVMISRNIVHSGNKEIKISSKKAISQHETNLDSTISSKEELKRPIRLKIASSRTSMYQKCDCSRVQDVKSLQIENANENNLIEDNIEVKQEPFDNTILQSDECQASFPQPFKENETLQTMPPDPLRITRTNDTSVELSIDQLEAHHLDDNYHFLISLLPHIKKLPAEQQMLLRIQMQELVYKKVYKKNTD
ncbi:uncharacterized protein [Chelonus insularis]|uniref:uncharacterized protein n=1 Tax=Chelonus insularis TaxID=460826 RepID=UPI001589ED01|nr:uncharacterized protein LOC118066729 [Chelonus insularis]